MDTSAPSPASSSSDSHSSYSPHLMTSDLGLDPSDPLNLLLHNTSQLGGNTSTDESSQEGGSPPDWSQLSSLWPDNDFNTQTKPYSDMMDFSDLASLSMDMDFGNAIAIEPSVLQLNPNKYGFDDGSIQDSQLSYNSDLLTAQFPFTLPPSSEGYLFSDASSLQSSHSGRRLSVTSSSSSSGASFSPAPEMAPSPLMAKPTEVPAQQANTNRHSISSDPAVQLAERVRQSAGVMLALPMDTQLQALESQYSASSAPVTSPTTAPKLPIPRLPRQPAHSVKSTSSVSSAASTPPPSTPSPPPTTSAPTPNVSAGPLPRPKTSHTTIERRYRTNLNARIQSLRMAVPALRVVEDRDGSKKRAPNKVLVSSDPLKLESVVDSNGVLDVIDDRGYVDGVKVARKCSKANVLGKAVEYIRVLKKREHRLKAEQAGLKSLISGLVGGPALLREWEREWRELFGGDEKDEVEGEMEAEADEDDSDEDQDDDDEGGRKRKRGKMSTSASSAPARQEKKEKKLIPGPDGVVPEKRKRGRPRKVVPSAVPPSPPSIVQPGMQVEQGQAPQQYLLAVFALFSFFSSPLTTTTSTTHASHVHVGKVLNGSAPAADTPTTPWGISDFIQVLHLIVSVVVLLSFMSSWIGLNITIDKTKRSGLVLDFRGARRSKKTLADWVHEGEDCVLSASDQTPLHTRIQLYHQISSWSSARAQELATAALILHGAGGIFGSLARLRARAVWAAAKARAHDRAAAVSLSYERMVLDEMTVDDATKRLKEYAQEHVEASPLNNEDSPRTPTQVLAVSLIKERIRAHLGILFVASVRASEEEEPNGDKEVLEQEEARRFDTIEAAKELGGDVGNLGRSLERVWKLPSDRLEEEEMFSNEDGESGGIDGEVTALLVSLVLYRKVFLSVRSGVSSLMSPPPSPGRKDASYAGMLRRVLGSRVFEESEVLEDARDRAVDLIVELERKSVGLD